MKSILDPIRKQLGPAPRRLNPDYQKEFLAHRPTWLSKRGWLVGYPAACLSVVCHNEIHWGVFIGVSSEGEGDDRFDYLGLLVTSNDAYYDDHLDELRDIAGDVAHLIDLDQAPPEPSLAAFYQQHRNTEKETLQLAVPAIITGGRRVALTTVPVHEKQLPRNQVALQWLPVFPARDHEKFTVLVDSQFWPRDYADYWNTGVWQSKTF